MISTDEDSGDKIDSLDAGKVATVWEDGPWKSRRSRSWELRTLHNAIIGKYVNQIIGVRSLGHGVTGLNYSALEINQATVPHVGLRFKLFEDSSDVTNEDEFKLFVASDVI